MNQPSLESRPNPNEPLGKFLQQFALLNSAEEKLRSALEVMRGFVEKKENLPFKEFWEVRKLCLPLFKENISQNVRAQLWNEYIALTREGRELKNIIDEEAHFAAEQIEIAIKALEEEVSGFLSAAQEVSAQTRALFPEEPKAIEGKYPYYLEKQHLLNHLNAYAERINALRKELIKIPMRFRFKNKFFQSLSELGDKVFPPRRELIKEISASFEGDVKEFVEAHFSERTFSHEKVKRSLFFFREEIKSLQACAKTLTLNTAAFSTSREELSKCWDKLKGMEKEIKKHYSEQKVKSQENKAPIVLLIEELKKRSLEEGAKEEEICVACDDILRKMREVELTRNDVQALKEEIRLIKEPFFKKKEEEEKRRREEEAALVEKRRASVEALKSRLEAIKERVKNEGVDWLLKEVEECLATMNALALSKKEKAEFEKTVKRITQEIEEKKEEAILLLSDDDKKALASLMEVLNQRKERRSEIKKQLEDYRKMLGGSSLDFGKAMEVNELVAVEKERLEKSEEGICEIEKKIRELKKRV